MKQILLRISDLEHGAVKLSGELPSEAMELEEDDELIHFDAPLVYDLKAQRSGDSLWLRGGLEWSVGCECSRCLKPFRWVYSEPHWALQLDLAGEDAIEQEGEQVDLTPYVREDILLALPQHPLCQADCRGLTGGHPEIKRESAPSGTSQGSVSWDVLDQLKLD